MKYNTFSSPINGLSRGFAAEVAAVVDRIIEAPFVWAERAAERRHLAELDDHLLRDIGARREDISWAASLPLSANSALALQERQRERMAKDGSYVV